MSAAAPFVCAFRGRRDGYQAPLALAEAGLLDTFITDAYAKPWLLRLSQLGPASLRAKMRLRAVEGIPVERVRCLWGTTVLEHARHRLGYAPMLTYNALDRRFAATAAARARRARAHLFLYAPYAWEAFTARYAHAPTRVLFQHHPHPALERRVLAADSRRHPRVGESFGGTRFGQVPDALASRDRDAWKHADLIFCASAFTRRSLLEAGADERRCRVVPYGVDVPDLAQGVAAPASFRALFVGSGGQRKGLHHLLLAWQRARLPASSTLTLVCRVIDGEIERMIARTPRIELKRGVPESELGALYAGSSLFVMPSLIEGFGQVYLEALAQGCPVLGSANTCLPDLGGEADGIYLVEPGNVDQLVARLEQLACGLPGDDVRRRAARACAERYTWSAFRHGIRNGLEQR